MYDVIIIGGSFAGLAAALQLGRARRTVTVLDTGMPRNRFVVGLFHAWTDRLTVFADGHDLAPDVRADLMRRNKPVVDGRIIERERTIGSLEVSYSTLARRLFI